MATQLVRVSKTFHEKSPRNRIINQKSGESINGYLMSFMNIMIKEKQYTVSTH